MCNLCPSQPRSRRDSIGINEYKPWNCCCYNIVLVVQWCVCVLYAFSPEEEEEVCPGLAERPCWIVQNLKSVHVVYCSMGK